MSATGWVFMILSVGFVVGLAFFCYRRVLKTPSDKITDPGPAALP